MASAICLVVGLFLVPNTVRVDRLECRLDEVCVPPKTPELLWQELTLPLTWLTLGAVWWVILANLVVTGVSMVSPGGVPRWLRLTYLVGGVCLTGVLAVDALSLLLLLPGPGVLFVLAGLLLMALAWWRMRSDAPRRAAAGGVVAGGGSAS